MNEKFLNGLKSLCKLLITKINPFKPKRTYNEYYMKNSNYKESLFSVLEKILNKNIKRKEIVELIKNLNIENKKIVIDHIINEEEIFLMFSKKEANDITEILSKEPYFKEKLLENLRNNISDCENRLFFEHPNNPLVNSLEVSTKEEFLFIFSKRFSIPFFLLNCNKFNYTQEEKEKFEDFFNNFYLFWMNSIINLDIQEINKIKERTSVSTIFTNIDIKNNFNRDRFNHFVNNINNIKLDEIKYRIIFNNLFNDNEALLSIELYHDFFSKNTNLIKPFEKFLINEVENYSKIKNIIGLAEKLIYEEQLNNF